MSVCLHQFLVQYFQQENIPLSRTIDPPAVLKGDEARLSLLGARLFVVMAGDERPVGYGHWGT
jgi:hypothetical protein